MLASFLGAVLENNGLEGCTYVEPYAGGAGAALSLLYSEHVRRVVLNDIDRCIFAFWRSVLLRTEELLRLIRNVPLSIPQWKRQRDVYRNPGRHSELAVGFATFYLNRTNHSGIILDGGPIGGISQNGPWKLDARFPRAELIRRVERVAMYKDRIEVRNLDAKTLMTRLDVPKKSNSERVFLYLDPPYFSKGRELYFTSYTATDHKRLANYLLGDRPFDWVLTYDRVPAIVSLYGKAKHFWFNLRYSANVRRAGRELLIVGPRVNMPLLWRRTLPMA